MKFWNDQLRVCPKCKAAVKMAEELRTSCPKCGSQVWFYNYRPLPPPLKPPETRPRDLWKNPTTTLLLAGVALFGLVALVGISNRFIVAVVCSLAAIGFAVFGLIRHAETRRIEEGLEHADETFQYAEAMQGRISELINRYNYLLKTGNQRIEEYYGEIYLRAEKEKEEAQRLRQRAQRDREAVRSVEVRIYNMAERLIDDHRKWATKKLRPDPENYQRRKLEIEKMFQFVDAAGYEPPADLRKGMLSKLKGDYKAIVREHTLKEEQKRIKQQMREEEQLRREREQAIKEAEENQHELERLLEEALKEHKDAHNAEVEELRLKLAEAQANSERAKSMAQLTKAGHVYILSNIGSFGEGIFKVGMTRRLEPQLRVKELGDASVPFPFDVHAMISCENAPGLENALHKELARFRVNRVNLRKEYFRVDLETIVKFVKHHHGHVDYIAEAEALEYRETVTISPEDLVELESELAEMGVTFEEWDD